MTVKVNPVTTPTDRSPTPVSLVRSESPSAAGVSTKRLHAFSFPFILSSRETTELFRSSVVKFDQIHDTVTATPLVFLSRKREGFQRSDSELQWIRRQTLPSLPPLRGNRTIAKSFLPPGQRHDAFTHFCTVVHGGVFSL